jgi:DNA-binding NtrC family response regulator
MADRPVLLLGDTGSGKELFAQYFMNVSRGKKIREGKQRTVNCATFSDSLLRDEIFGHVRGAYTGAESERKGLLQTCDKGILFLDELDKASTEFQHAILRVAEGYSFRQQGSDREITDNNALIIAAASRLSHINDQLVNRFHVLAVPPLQKFDIPVLAEYFLGKPMKDEVSALLENREYPGNVRELKKFCEKLSIERGKNLYSGSKRRQHHVDHQFDYERFSDEFLLWHEYLAPIIEKFRLDIRYVYQQGSEEEPSTLPGEMIHLVKVLRHGSEDAGHAYQFDEHLRRHIKNLELSYLLGEIYTTFKAPLAQDLRGRMDSELPKLMMHGRGHQGGDDATALTVAEDIADPEELTGKVRELLSTSIGDARKKFSKLYLEHVLGISGNDLDKAATKMGLTKKGLETTLRRHGI